MSAEIIAIGTELTTGAKLDTNSQWLSTELSAVGIEVMYHVTVADSLSDMVDAFRIAASRSDLVLITGGLGPTLDDLTRQALADMLGVPLVLHEPSLAHIQSMFSRRNREMPERNVIQAQFPAGAEPLDNPIGTAPGIWCEIPRDDGTVSRFAAFPGVPSEMKKMFREQVIPRLPIGRKIIRGARVNCFGVGESDAEQMLGELTARGRNPEVGITVHEATITLRINAVGSTIDECETAIADARQSIHERLGELVFGEEDEELEHVTLRLLQQRGQTLATVESGTGGLLAHRLTDVAGYRETYFGGVVIPGGGRHWDLLSITSDWLTEHGTVSRETAAEMAQHCRDAFETDFALAVTECPPDDPGQQQSPQAWLALAWNGGVSVVPHRLLGDQTLRKSRAAKATLNLLRLHLLRAET